jgi:hypothetical protein
MQCLYLHITCMCVVVACLGTTPYQVGCTAVLSVCGYYHRNSVSFISVYLNLQLFYKINSTILIFHCAIYVSNISTCSTSQLTTYMSFISFMYIVL